MATETIKIEKVTCDVCGKEIKYSGVIMGY